MIYIDAYFNKNLGDDLFVRTLVRRYPNEIFYVSEKSRKLGDLIAEPNLRYIKCLDYILLKINNRIIYGTSEITNYTKMKKSKALVCIGGSIFIEREGWEHRKNKHKNENVFYVGTNFGPYYTESYKQEIRARIKNSKSCCFRDLYSYNMFKDLENTGYAPDVLFGYPYYPEYKVGEAVGISVIDLYGRKELSSFLSKYEEGIIKICKHYRQLGKKIILLGFCEPEGDDTAIKRIMDKLDEKDGISSKCYDGNIDKFLDVLNDCEKIYATRFHAMILGFVMRKKVIPIIYSKKQTHILEDLCYEGPVWNLMEGEALQKQYLDSTDYSINENLLKKLISDSDKHFFELDKFLKIKS